MLMEISLSVELQSRFRNAMNANVKREKEIKECHWNAIDIL